MSCMQNLSFIISSSYFIKVLSDDLSTIIYKIFSVVRPLYIINALALSSLYKFFLSISMLYMFFYLMLIILIVYKDLKNTLQVPLLMRIFKRLSYMNFYLWYIPLNELLLTPVYCVFITDKDSALELFSPDLCIGGNLDVVLAFFGVLFYGIMMITCLMNVLFFVDMTYNAHNALAKSDSLMEIYTFLSKNLLIILLIFLKYLQKSIFFLAFLICLEISHILALREFIQKPNFFNPRVEKFFGLTLFLELYVFSYVLLFTILNVLGSDANTGLGLFLTILLPFRFFLNNFQNNYLKNLGLSIESIESPPLIDKKLKLLFIYLKGQEAKKAQNPKKKRKFNLHFNKNESRILIVWGYLFTHLKTCVNKLCFCHNEDEKLFDYSLKYEYRPKLDNPMKNLESLIYLKYFIRQQYKDAISIMKTNLGLRLNLAYFNFFQLNNYHQALLEAFELNAANSHLKGLNYRNLFLIKRLELEIRDLLGNLNENKENDELFSNFNIESLLDLEVNYSTLESKISEFRALYTKFFFKLSNTSIILQELEADCSVLFSLRNEIQKIFENHLQTNPRAIKLYLGYLNNLVFKNDQGYNIEKKLKELLEKIHANEGQNHLFYQESLIYNENSMIFQVGGEYKNLGQILKTNQGSGKILGYQTQELELSNINVIMSIRIKRFHDSFLNNFMKTGRTEKLYKENTSFLRKKNGYIISAALLIKPFFNSIINEFRFLGFLRPLKRSTEYVITDMYGGIEGMTENLSKLFNVHPEDYERNPFYIQILCPKLYSFFIERNEKVHNIFLESQNSSNRTNRTNRTNKFKEIQNLDLMELLDLPKTLSNEAILRFYRYNDGELFVDLRSIINAIIEKMRKKKTEEINPETPQAKSSGMDKWNLVKRKFIKIAMMGNFFNCKTKINYFKTSDNSYEWLVFSITEIEFTRKLKIMQMVNKSVPFGTMGTMAEGMNNSYRASDNNYDPNVFNRNFPTILGFQPPPILPNNINGNMNNHSNIPISTNINPNPTNINPTNINPTNINPTNINPSPNFERMIYQKKISMAYDPNNQSIKGFEPPINQSPRPKNPTVQYIKEFAQTGIDKIVIHPESNDEENEEQDNLIVASESYIDIEGMVLERVSIPVEASKGLDSNKKRASSPKKKMYNKTLTGHSTLKDPVYSNNLGKTFESMNSSDFGIKLLIPNSNIDINPFMERNLNEVIPLPNQIIPLINIEEEEDKMAENIINFTGNQLFEDKSDDLTDISVKMGQKTTSKKSIKGGNMKQRKRSVAFRARFEGDGEKSPKKAKEGSSPKGGISPKFKNQEKLETTAAAAGTVNKEDLKVINKTLKDISMGLTRGVDEMDDDSDKKTVRSTKLGARTIKTIKSMNKKTNVNVTFTPKTHKLLDILRETIVKKLALEEDGNKKDKAYEQSVHSSISSIYQSHRLTEKAIMVEYLPKCYKRLSWSLFFLLIFIIVLQISIYLIIVGLYDGFRANLIENVNYDKFSNSLLQSLKEIFIYRTIQNQTDFPTKSYYETYLPNVIENQFNVIANLLHHIQLNYDFYHDLSNDFFIKKAMFNLTMESDIYQVFPFDLMQAVTLYLSEIQKMLLDQEFNTVFVLENLFQFTEQMSYHDNFAVRRSDLIITDKLAILVILILISVIIIGIFFIRIHSHLICYEYMNFLLELLARTNYEDIETLKTYYISIASVYDLQQELKGPGQNQMLGINYLENPQASKKNNDPNNKNTSHRMMDLGFLKIPTFQIVFMNFLLAIFMIGINLIVVILSHGFDSYFEDSGNLQKQLINQFNFKGYSNSYVLAYDRSLDAGVYNLSYPQILDFLNNNLPNNSMDENNYQSQDSFVTYYLEIITNEEICTTMTQNTTTIARCESILNGLMKKSLINFELEAFQTLKLMTIDQNKVDVGDFNAYLELGEALDYALILVDFIRVQYITSEDNNYNSEINILIAINCVSICFSFIMITGYYLFSLRKLARRLVALRRIFINIPIAILMRQKRVRKYLQDTSEFYLGG